jgi:hypothetical protein
MLFLDGVGIGRRDPTVNPLFHARLPGLQSLLEGNLPSLRRRSSVSKGSTLIPLDATLGVAGLPQSGTGQTALFTGINAPRRIGRHFGPHPYSTLRPVIEESNIFRALRAAGKSSCFANAFPQRFFEYIEHRRTRVTVTTYACLASGVPLRGAGELGRAEAVSADITGEGWSAMGYPDMPVVTPEVAGGRLASLARAYEFVLFEYWKTDHAGHERSMHESVSLLEKLDGLLVGIVDAGALEECLLVITSDHGNIEDLSCKTHTRNPVPLILAGKGHRVAAARILHHSSSRPDLTSVTPALLDVIAGWK